MPDPQHPALRKPMLGLPLGPFVLRAVLGEGAMGVVYKGERQSDGAVVAVKTLRHVLSKDDVFLGRFRREARIAEQVRHRHLVPVLEAGEDDGVHFIAMVYVDGTSLAQRIDEKGSLPIDEAVRLVKEVSSGLDALHEQGLVHRDVKPSNILVDGDGSAVLTDFGLARGQAFTVLTKAGEVMGTPNYISPEIIAGKEAGSASDVYGLACVAYECLTGAPPFAGRSLFEVAVAHVDEEPPDPREQRSELPADLVWGLLQGLAKDPARRPPSARAFAQLLAAGAQAS